MVEQVAALCPSGTPIPSKQWVRLQFWPKNPTTKASLQHTGRLKVKFMVRARQIRMWHEDAHYASAVYRYLREMAIKFRDVCELVFMDDKHKCKVGEPSFPVAAVERGKAVIVGVNGKTFGALDHDFTKCSVTPSVTMFCHIPEDIDDTFYSGKVYIGVKDSILEPSSAIRHAAELSQLMSFRGNAKSVIFFYTDGGPDHNLKNLKTMISLVNVFLEHDLDMLQAVRTPPYNSWKNPVERVNCILNLGLQSVGLMRSAMDEANEKKMKGSSTMKAIRCIAESDPQFKEAFADSMASVKVLISEVFQRLKLKDDPIKVFLPAKESEIENVWKNILSVDNTVTKKDTAKKVLLSLKKFFEHCCSLSHYSFGVKKCGMASCSIMQICTAAFRSLQEPAFSAIPAGER